MSTPGLRYTFADAYLTYSLQDVPFHFFLKISLCILEREYAHKRGRGRENLRLPGERAADVGLNLTALT